MCQVQCMDDATAAVAAGADVLVAQGNEAGGHTGRLNLLPWLARLVDTFPDVPVMAAGGIASGRTLAAALADRPAVQQRAALGGRGRSLDRHRVACDARSR